jgi:hypothetical protein
MYSCGDKMQGSGDVLSCSSEGRKALIIPGAISSTIMTQGKTGRQKIIDI